MWILERRAGRLRHAGVWIAVCILLGGVLRWVAMEATFPQMLVGDERYYVHVGYNLAQGRGHQAAPNENAFRPPAASFLYSLFIDPVSRPEVYGSEIVLRPLLRLEVVLGTLVVAATALLAWMAFGPATAVFATAAAALHPTLIAYSHYLWSETLFALLLTLALATALWGQRRDSTAIAALCGLTLGAAALTRETAVGFAGVAALWWAWASWRRDRRRAIVQGAVLLGVAAAVVLPWTYRNYQLFHRFVPIATVSWYSAAAGNMLERPHWYAPPNVRRLEFKREYAKRATEMERYDYARQRTLQEIRDEQPTWLFKKALRNLPLLFNPDSFLFYKVRLGAYSDYSLFGLRSLAVVSVLVTTLMLVAGALGIAGAPARAAPSLAVGVLALLAAGHIFAIANTRHRMPLEPMLLAYACHGLLTWRQLNSRVRGPRRVAVACVLAFFGLVCIPYFLVYSHTAALWTSGAPVWLH